MDGDEEVDHYVILGLPRGAKLSEEGIKEAYLSKLVELDPDKRPDDPNAHRDFLNVCASYKLFRDKKEKSRQSLRTSRLRNRLRNAFISQRNRARSLTLLR